MPGGVHDTKDTMVNCPTRSQIASFGLLTLLATLLLWAPAFGQKAPPPAAKAPPAPAPQAPPAPPAAASGKPLTPAQVAERALPSVVLIRTPSGLGSGFVASTDGKVVTNLHVINGAAEAI